MFMVCGEALMDVFAEHATPAGMALDARIGGSPLNVACGLARLGQRAQFLGALSSDFLGERLRRALAHEGVDVSCVAVVDAPTTLSLVGLDASGSASYSFYGEGGADRQLQADHLPVLSDDIQTLHFGSYSMVVEPVATTLRMLVQREHATRVVACDPNLRLSVEPQRAHWSSAVDWMVPRTHLLKISTEDLELLLPGVPLRQAMSQAANSWLAAGTKVVVVACGGDGARGFTPRDTVRIEALGSRRRWIPSVRAPLSRLCCRRGWPSRDYRPSNRFRASVQLPSRRCSNSRQPQPP
jgi:fructokinase